LKVYPSSKGLIAMRVPSMLLSALMLLLVACSSPAASPTAAPAKPTEAAKPVPATSAAVAAASPASAPAAASPAAQAVSSPAVTPQPSGSPAAASAPVDVKAVADFYRGKTVHIIVGFAAGGGFDLYSRLIAKYMGKYIPGEPTVIVENMPGASSVLAMNHIYNVAPKDGTIIGNVIGSIALQQLFNVQGVQFDMAKVQYLGMPVPGTLAPAVDRRAGISSVNDILGPNAKELIVGTTAPGAGNHDGAVLMKEVLGANIKIVPGYAGTAQVRLAMDNNEVNSVFNPWESTKLTSRDLVDSGQWIILTQFLDKPHPELPNVPLVTSVAKNDEQRQLLLYGGVIPNQFEKVYVTAPEVPRERVAALQDAFLKALQDKELLADAEKAKQDIAPVGGDEMRRRVVEFMGMSPDLRAKLEKVLKL
jgi:tripartite-type tricarboxylate transporter receptor subunit TctC